MNERASTNRFERLARFIPGAVLLAFLSGGLVLIAQPLWVPKAIWFSPLWFYGVFFVGTAMAGLVLLKVRPGFPATVLIYLMIIDIALAALSQALSKHDIGENLMPRRTHSIVQDFQYRYHPLLVVAPTPGYADRQVKHTDFGTRMAGNARALDPSRPKLVLIGGSTTYDTAASQGQTWADAVQRAIPEMQVINLGVGGYTSAEHVIQTAFYLPPLKPACAFYYMGWNDIRNAHIPALDHAYADFHFPNKIERLLFVRDPSFTALMRLISILSQRIGGVDVNLPAKIKTPKAMEGPDPAFDAIYRQNIRSIIALNRANGTPTGFIGQLFDNSRFASAKPGERHGYMPALAITDYVATMDRANLAMAEEAGRAGLPFLQPEQGWVDSAHFEDFGHFRDAGAAQFGAKVAPFIRRRCGLS
jgi:hypothetical protein